MISYTPVSSEVFNSLALCVCSSRDAKKQLEEIELCKGVVENDFFGVQYIPQLDWNTTDQRKCTI